MDAQPRPPSAASDTVVHALRYGETLCRKAGVPASWEPNHKWIQAHYCDPKDITCTECAALYESTMKRKLPGWRDDDERKMPGQ